MVHDWRDIENTVWVQDVPRRPSPIPHEPKADDFPSVLESVLCALNVAPAVTSLVLTDVRHISSVPCLSADQIHGSTLIFRSQNYGRVRYAHAGISHAYDRGSFRVLPGSTRAGPMFSSQVTWLLSTRSTGLIRSNGPSRSSTRYVPPSL